MEPIAPMSPVLATSTMASLFGTIKVSSKVGVEVGDQPVGVGVGAKIEVRSAYQGWYIS